MTKTQATRERSGRSASPRHGGGLASAVLGAVASGALGLAACAEEPEAAVSGNQAGGESGAEQVGGAKQVGGAGQLAGQRSSGDEPEPSEGGGTASTPNGGASGDAPEPAHAGEGGASAGGAAGADGASSDCSDERPCCAQNEDCDPGAECGVFVPNRCAVRLTSLAAGYNSVIGLDPQGGVWAWGFHPSPTRMPAPESVAPPVAKLATGAHHFCALEQGGTLWCSGQPSVVPQPPFGVWRPVDESEQPLSGVIDVAAGVAHTCVILEDGYPRCWGENDAGQLGDGGSVTLEHPTLVDLPDQVAIAAGGKATCTLGQDHSVHCWGNCAPHDGVTQSNVPVPIPDPTTGGFVAVSVAQYNPQFQQGTACARKADGSVWCWGKNQCGRLGDGTIEDRSVPSQVLSGTGTGYLIASSLALGTNASCAVDGNGHTSCWGCGGSQLGDGLGFETHAPSEIPFFLGSVSVVAGGRFGCALKSNGTAWCWGTNNLNQLGQVGPAESYEPLRVDPESFVTPPPPDPPDPKP